MFDVSDLWAELGDIPIDADEKIEEQFLNFEIGTDKEAIWHWFEDTFDIAVADLMYGAYLLKRGGGDAR